MPNDDDPLGSHRELLEFFCLHQGDLDALAEIRRPLERNTDRLVDEFYRHLLQNKETQRLLRSAEVRERLFEQQRTYLQSLADPVIDREYVDRRIAIGSTHERVGLPTRWYLGAYSLYFNLLLPVVSEAVADSPEIDRERIVTALVKRLLFDAELAISQYLDRRESDLRYLNRELTRASQALTREVGRTSRNLRQTEARARAAEELASVANLVTGLAHEIGTPMGVLRGHAEALESAVEGDRAKWRLDMILEQIDRITSIIQSLLNIARPKATLRISLSPEEVADTSLAFLAEKLRRRDVSVTKHVSNGHRVLGDPEKLQQVFLNLIINAIDSMPQGGRLDLHIEDDEEGDVLVCIADSGGGIRPEDLGSVFDPFFTTKEAGHGSGLGLVVVKGIVEEHGGTIDVESELDVGTRFTLRLPSVPEGQEV